MTHPIPSSPRRSTLVRQDTQRRTLEQIELGLDTLLMIGSLRFATGIQLRRALFDRRASSPRRARAHATRTLRQLFDSGFLRRVPVLAPSATSGTLSRQVVHVVSASGARAIGQTPRWARTRAPRSQSVLGHDFWLVEVAVLALEGRPEPLEITRWWDDRVLSARQRRGTLSLPNIPDALLVIHNPATGKDYPCLVELDLGTESVRARQATRRDISRKISGYLEYSPATFQAEFGLTGNPVMLVICDSERRLAEVRELTARLGGAGRFWFSTLSRLRGLDAGNQQQTDDSAGLQGPFWASNWQTAQDGGWRSLAARCGALDAFDRSMSRS